MKNKYREEGQTLIEALVAFTVAIMVLVALVAVTTVALHRSNFAENQVRAQDFAQEGIEWIRLQRDNNWSDLYNRSSGGNGRTWCFNASDPSWSSGSCGSYSLNGLFKREAVLIRRGTEKVEVQITVEWQEGGRTHESKQTTYLTSWQ